MAGAAVSATAKYANALCFWTNFVTDDLPVRKPAGNIVVRNCTVRNADRMLHLNLSGNEPWQSGCPLKDVKFENIKAEGIRYPINIYGDKDKHINLRMENVEISMLEGFEHNHLISAANFDLIELKYVNVKNATGNVLIKKWTDDNNIVLENVKFSDDYKVSELQTEAFVCNPI